MASLEKIDVNGIDISISEIPLNTSDTKIVAVPNANTNLQLVIDAEGILLVQISKNDSKTIEANVVVTFTFKESSGDDGYSISAITSDSAKGSVSEPVSLGDNEYYLTATPSPGYMLDYWEWTSAEGDWTNATRIENDLFENDKTTIIETITEDRWYRAVFKPWQFIMPGGAAIKWGGSIPWGLEGVVKGYGSPMPASEKIRSGKPAILIFKFGWPCEIDGGDFGASPGSSGVSVSLYAGDCTADPTAAPFSTYPVSPSFNGIFAPNTGTWCTYIESLPNAGGITVEVKTETGISTRKYYPLTIEQDLSEGARNKALADLKSYYFEHFAETPLDTENSNTGHRDFERVEERRADYNSFSAVRILLRRAYEDALTAIRFDAGTEDAITAAYNAAIARFNEFVELNDEIKAGNGEYYKNINGIIRVLFYQNSDRNTPPVYAYVPADSVVRDALEAAMENWSPGQWTINGGSFITYMNYTGGDGKVEAGGTSSQIVYSQNHKYALGVGSQTMQDRDVLNFGSTITTNAYPTLAKIPDKTDLVWALGALAEKYGFSVVNENTVFKNAMEICHDWSVAFSDGVAHSSHGYPESLSAAQTAVDNALAALKEAYPTDNLLRLDLPADVLNVMNLIDAIGDITPQSGEAITTARAAYDALATDNLKAQVPNYAALEAAEAAFALFSTPAGQASAVRTEALPALQESYNAHPATGSIGGEWAVLGIARGGLALTDTETKYLGKLNALLTEKGLDGIGGSNKYTEYSRITLALSSLGIDAQTYSYAGTGYDFISKLTDYDHVTSQGVNGAIFALLALDSKPYLPGNTTIRDQYADYILERQHNDGGWALDDTKTEPSDPDVTAMALQALANYQSLNGVPAAITNGLAALKGMQDTTHGGFYSWNQYNSESAAQVIVALTALGIDPTGAQWTVGDSKNPVTALLTFYDGASKMFRHALNGGADPMATEQSVYALVALDRLNTPGKTTLYDMSDIFGDSSEDAVNKTGLRDAITVASALRPGDYTSESWDALQTALTAAQAVNGNVDATQEEVGSARAGLIGAIGNLKLAEITENKSVLNAAIAIGNALGAEDYNSASWGEMHTTLSEAEAVAADAKQSVVDEAANNLLTALADLERAPETELLNAAIAKAEDASLALTEADYTAATWTAYSSALAAAKAVTTPSSIDLSLTDSDTPTGEQAATTAVTQDAIDFAAQSLISGIGGLKAESTGGDQDYTAVTALLTAIKGALTEGDYTPETWSALSAAEDKSALTYALCGLQLKDELDYTALRTILEKAGALTQSDYTEASYKAFADTLSASLKLEQGIYTEQDAIDHDAAAILTAMRGLTLSNVAGQANKALLKVLMDQASALQEARYTPETWSALHAALTGANAVYGKADAAQAEVDEAKDVLLDAVGKLETAAGAVDVDKAELNEKIAEASQITNVGKGYTTASWMSFQNALAHARTISEDASATQAEVNNAIRDLRAAIQGLTEYSDDGTGGVVLPNDPTGYYAYISVTDPNAKAGQTRTYFPRTQMELREGETAYSILQRTELTLRVSTHPIYAGIYVEAINDFGEFDDGPLSGWMYKVNGVFPNYSSSLYTLEDGDEVEWVYTRDLGKDVGDTWLADSGSNNGDTTIAPAATGSGDKASVSLSLEDMKDAIAGAKTSGNDIVIAPTIKGTVKAVQVELAKVALTAIAGQTEAGLTIQTPVGSITISNDALASIASQASGSKVAMNLESVDKSALTPEQQKAVGTGTVYDISLVSGGKNISSFGGSSITISLPYTLKAGEDPSGVKVWYLNDAGELKQIECTYDEKSGLASFATSHLSYYLVGVEADAEGEDSFTISFTDVKEGDWFYDAVKYVVKKGLFEGTGTDTFSPNTPMTRAMLVTVLYRLEGKPAVTGTSGFTDVKSGEWYTDAVIWANANVITDGYGNGLFGTNDSITREQMATILYRYAGYKGYDVTGVSDLKAYTDAADISDWAQSAMSWANREGLITGRTTDTLVPGGDTTRAEVATILQRFVEGLKE